jgi:hypothetical protein
MQPNKLLLHKTNAHGQGALCQASPLPWLTQDWQKVTCKKCLLLRQGTGPIKIELIEPFKTIVPIGLALWINWARKVLKLK